MKRKRKDGVNGGNEKENPGSGQKTVIFLLEAEPNLSALRLAYPGTPFRCGPDTLISTISLRPAEEPNFPYPEGVATANCREYLPEIKGGREDQMIPAFV